jgi:hypothetical protein
MCKIIEDALSVKMQSLQAGLQLRTPDNAVGEQFSVAQITQTTITINWFFRKICGYFPGQVNRQAHDIKRVLRPGMSESQTIFSKYAVASYAGLTRFRLVCIVMGLTLL